jgi:hypothetical protein
MADPVKMKARIANLVANNKKFTFMVDALSFEDVVAVDTTDDHFLRAVVKWNNAGIPGYGGRHYIVPIGLVQLDIPYMDIHEIIEFAIDPDLYAKIPPEIIAKYKRVWVEE